MQNLSVLADASLPDLARWFPHPFKLNLYTIPPAIKLTAQPHSILLCRSTLQVNEQLPGINQLTCIATASSGTDHIDSNYLKQKNIKLFDAKGSNAHAVADYVLANIACVQQRGLLTGQRAAVVGAGHVGMEVGKRLSMIGFEVIWIDPLKQTNTQDFSSSSFQELSTCDLICIHANLHDTPPFPSNNLFNQALLSSLKQNVVLINAARGGIVNESDLLNMPNSMIYCTDVYANEPNPNPDIIERATICTPHIAGHSIEAKIRAVVQISTKIHEYYGISTPDNTALIAPNQHIYIPVNWQKKILYQYNPDLETKKLKSATNKKNIFIKLRQAHIHRHELILE